MSLISFIPFCRFTCKQNLPSDRKWVKITKSQPQSITCIWCQEHIWEKNDERFIKKQEEERVK